MKRTTIDSRPFHFRQFSLFHHRSTMKTGTDAILLGIWTDISNTNEILDIGSGSGIISLFMASRSKANVTAIEIDSESVIESKSNFISSKFSNRLNVIESDFNNYSNSTNAKYDLIVSNPPFFTNDLHSPDKRKSRTRHAEAFTFIQLCSGVSKILNQNGRFCVVIPYSQQQQFCKIAQENGLHPSKKLLIFPRRGVQPNRINIEFCKQNNKSIEQNFFIMREENNKFSMQYHKTLGDYYLSIPEQ